MRTARKEEKKFTHVRISMNKRKQWKYYRELKVVGSRPRPMPKLLGSYTPLPPGPFGAKGPRAWWSQLAAAADLESADSDCKRCSNLAWQKHFPGGLREVRCGMALDALVDGNKRQKNPACSWTGNITVMLDLKNAGKSTCHGKVRVEGGRACSSTYGIIFGSADTKGEHFLYKYIYIFI